MALTATLHTLHLALNDSDRAVYEQLELRIARHPSETLPYMLSRTLAYALFWTSDISFTKGLSTADEPALWVKAADGRITHWIDVGHPSAERLHKASKAAEHVAVCTFDEPSTFRRTFSGARIHRGREIELVGLPPTLLDPLSALVTRRMSWELTVTDGQLYLAADGQTLTGAITRGPLLDEQ